MMEIGKHIGTALSLEFCNYKRLLHLGAARVKLISLSSALSVSADNMCQLQTADMTNLLRIVPSVIIKL